MRNKRFAERELILNGLVDSFMKTKTELCTENNGPADNIPLIVGVDNNGVGFFIPDALDEHPAENLEHLLSALSSQLLKINKTLSWDWIGYLVEGFMKSEPEKMGYEAGTLENDYHTNIESSVQEVLVVSLFSWEGDDFCTTVPYKYGDDGMPVWGEMFSSDTRTDGVETGGRIRFIFQAFRKFCTAEGDLEKLGVK